MGPRLLLKEELPPTHVAVPIRYCNWGEGDQLMMLRNDVERWCNDQFGYDWTLINQMLRTPVADPGRYSSESWPILTAIVVFASAAEAAIFRLRWH